MKKVLEENYRNGKLHWSENYLNGKLHGVCEGWYVDGKRYMKDYHLK